MADTRINGGPGNDAPLVTNAAIQPGNVKYFRISKKLFDQTIAVDITGAISEFFFYESVLSNTITATAVIIDTGYANNPQKDDKLYKTQGLLNTLDLSGGERVDFEIEDNNLSTKDRKESIITLQNGMYINRIRDLSTNSLKNVFALDLVPAEYINNEKVRVTERYDGKISDSAYKIILKLVPEELRIRSPEKNDDPTVDNNNVPEIDPTALDYNFIGNDKKPLYVLSWLASKAVPAGKSETGSSVIGKQAGYFFYQSRKRFHFVSIDNRLKGVGYKKNIKKYIYNGTGRINEKEYDQNILSYTVKKTVDIGKDLALGTYSNRSIFFDFLSLNYRPREFDVTRDSEQDLGISNNYLSLPTREITEGPSRLMSHVLDVGTLPKGVNSDQQLTEWKKNISQSNYRAEDTMVQSIMRYNLLFSTQTNIVVPGDFSIEAGDIISCTFRSLDPDTEFGQEGDLETTGLYMVASVCHRMTPTETFSSLDLIKDSKSKRAEILNQ